MALPVIDLFAGPGGLGEGFSSVAGSAGARQFKIGLSIEMNPFAHRTLELRAFFREFPLGEAPAEYYDYLAGRISREELFEAHPSAARSAQAEAWQATLGSPEITPELLDQRIAAVLQGTKKWALIGGPPCQAYSLVGRSRIIGREGVGVYDEDPRHHLYEHYLRIIAVHRPPVFVMENVKGLLSAKVKSLGMFDRILKDLRRPWEAVSLAGGAGGKAALEYRLIPLTADRADLLGETDPKEFVLHAEDYGVPQARHRIIILGIRSDLVGQPGALQRQPTVTAAEVLGDLPRLRSGLSKDGDTPKAWQAAIRAMADAPWLSDARTPPGLRKALAGAMRHIPANLDRGAAWREERALPQGSLSSWYLDPKLTGVCNHESRGHIPLDLHRYFFAAVFAREKGRSPLLEDFPDALLPKHQNVEAALLQTKFNDRFRVQLADRPSTTVVSHIAKDGHYYIHYDPTQCRSLTVREAARLQTFPDNYFFEGPRTEQYKQVGNAVPPFLARQIAHIVAELLV